jgi:hypothetical protein
VPRVVPTVPQVDPLSPSEPHLRGERRRCAEPGRKGHTYVGRVELDIRGEPFGAVFPTTVTLTD